MQRVAVDSSMIASIGYDASSTVLEIEFTSGSIYQYDEVPADHHNGIMKAESHGKYFNENIKEVFPYRQIR
jgi:uncharacterized Fe-S cluster-containing MiaB family protein